MIKQRKHKLSKNVIKKLNKKKKKTSRLKQEKKGKGLRTYTSKHKAPQLDFDRSPQSNLFTIK